MPNDNEWILYAVFAVLMLAVAVNLNGNRLRKRIAGYLPMLKARGLDGDAVGWGCKMCGGQLMAVTRQTREATPHGQPHGPIRTTQLGTFCVKCQREDVPEGELSHLTRRTLEDYLNGVPLTHQHHGHT